MTPPRWLGLALPLMLASASALAEQRPQVAISSHDCGWLDDDTLSRLTHLELSEATLWSDRLSIDYTCQLDEVRISIIQNTTGARVSRQVASPCCDDPEPERTLALLAAGLLQAGRQRLDAPLIAPPTPPDAGGQPGTAAAPKTPDDSLSPKPEAAPLKPPPASQPVHGASPASKEPAGALAARSPSANSTGPDATSSADPTPSSFFRHELEARGRLTSLSVSSPIAGYGAGLAYRYWALPALAVGALAEATIGSASQPGGSIDTRIFELGATASWRMLQHGALSLMSTARASAAFIMLEGATDDARYATASVSGLTANLGLGVMPAFRFGRAQIALPLDAGFLLPAPRALLENGETLQIDGFWLSASLAFGLGWDPQAPPPN